MIDVIIVNDKDIDGFIEEAKEIQATGIACLFNYVEKIDDHPGGWGCAKFSSGVLPPGRLFDQDDDEYRYSVEQNGWLKNGELASPEEQSFVTGLYEYFQTQEGVPL